MTTPKSLGARGAWYAGDAIYSVELSSDGRHVLTAGLNGRLPPQLFFAMSGERVRTFDGAPEGQLPFSGARFIAGGRLAVATGALQKANVLRFWDVATGAIVGERPMEPVLSLVDPETDRGVVAWMQDTSNIRHGIVLLDPADRTEPALFAPHPAAVYAFLTGGKILGALAGKGLAVWGPDGRLVGELSGSLEPAMMTRILAVSPDRRRALLAADTEIEIWNLDTRQRERLVTVAGRTVSVTFFPDSARVLRVSDHDMRPVATILDMTTGVESAARPFPDGFATTAAMSDPPQISRDGRWLVVGSGSRVSWFDMENGFANPFRSGHTGSVHKAALSHDGARLVSSDTNGAILSWELATGEHRRLDGWTRGTATFLAFTPEGRVLAASSQGGAAFIDATTGAEVGAVGMEGDATFVGTEDASTLLRWTDTRCEIRTPPGSTTGVVLAGGWDDDPPPRVRRFLAGAWLSADGRTVLTYERFSDAESESSPQQYELRLWNAATGAKVATRVVDVPANEAAVGLLPGGKALIADDQGMLASIDVATGERVVLAAAPLQGPEVSGSLVTSGADQLAVGVFDLATSTSRGVFTADEIVSTWQFGPRGKSLIAAKEDGTFLIWDL